MKPVTGRIHSFQSMGAVDGPGIRYVVFLQGCPLRCVYCHNPDTWETESGTSYTAEAVVERILRYRSYFGKDGGVTVTGGEPLLQAPFVTELFTALHSHGIHTALDTSGMGDLQQAERLLKETDLVLADVKFLTEEDYHRYCHGSFAKVKDFLALTQKLETPLWIRHVVVPGLTDGKEHIKKLGTFCHQYTNLKKIELLPFRKLCLEKYQSLGIPFPLQNTPQMDSHALEKLYEILNMCQS